MTTEAAAPLHQAVAIEHGMDGAFGRNGDAGEPADQTLADLPRTPTGVLMLHVQDVVLHLEGELIGVAIGTSAPVGQPLHPTFLVAIKDLVAGLAGDPELPAQLRHGLASYVASHKLKPFVHYRTTPSTASVPLPPFRGRKCNLCLRYEVLPMCRVAHNNLQICLSKTCVQLRPTFQPTRPAPGASFRL